VHLAWLGCPVLGDRWYGGPQVVEGSGATPVPRICLHAHRLEVAGAGPGGADLALEAPVPDFFGS
jgi:23S rRNA-/tRNA-specific pseudouridylate synthase